MPFLGKNRGWTYSVSDTPSKFQPIDSENFGGVTQGGTNARVVDEMPMAHITNTRDRASLMKFTLKPMTCPDFTAIDCIYGWSPKSQTTSATHNGTHLHKVTYSMCHRVSVCAYIRRFGRQPYSVSETPGKLQSIIIGINNG